MAAMAPPPLKYLPCHRAEGLVSEEALRIIVEAKACFVALALALAYLLTASQHRLWSSSHLIKGFLFTVTQPVTRFLVGMFTMLLAMPFRNDLYLLWGILLLAGYEGVYAISGYCVSARRSDLAVHEFARAYNIVLVGLYVRYYSRASQFRYPLWALWALMVAKFLDRIFRFKVAKERYGDANTHLVADYMRHEDKIPTTGDKDFPMKDCNYLIVGDDKMKPEEVDGKEYEAQLTPANDTVTVARVWQCDGNLLRSEGTGNPLKDVCLSFALCKLLRRKFTGVAAAESEKTKARRLVFDDLLESGSERAFRVVRTELGFLRDLMYTKYPILFSSSFPVVSTVLFAATIAVSVWITVSAVRHYRVPRGSTSYVVHGKNVDLIITFAIVGMVSGMEICEFFIHLFSDWTKVMVISEYVRKQGLQHRFFDILLRLVCSGKIAEPIGTSLGQFDLLRATKKILLPERVIKLYRAARSFVLLTGDEDFRIKKCKARRVVPDHVQEMICETLKKNKKDLFNGHERLQMRTKLEGHMALSQYFNTPATAIETIMVWHVATCELAMDPPSEGSKSDYDVATTLSKYCAYLVFYKPKLLPIANNSVRFMCNKLVDEAKASFGSNQQGIVWRGQKVAEKFLGVAEKLPACEPWKALAEVWCELIISMAPQGSIGAHQKELGEGGEFITHLWALLYHAGVDEFSASPAAGDAAATRDDPNSQPAPNASMCDGE